MFLNITDCPEGLTYAPQNGSCIAFTAIVQPTKPADDTELDLENPAIGDATAGAASSVAATAPSLLVPVVTPKKQKDDDESSVPSVWSETRSS